MKISVTLLDSYRYWKETEFHSPERERQAGEEIIAKIQGHKPPKTEAMLRGIAFANVLEDPSRYYSSDYDEYRCDGFRFDAETFAEFQLLMPADALKEVWLPHYEIEGGHYLVGRVDAWKGNMIGDGKLITKAFNAAKYDSYDDSIQWKAYLLMGDCDKFEYYIGQGKTKRNDDLIRIEKPIMLPFYRSKATDERVIQLAIDFAKFAEPYLTEDQR